MYFSRKNEDRKGENKKIMFDVDRGGADYLWRFFGGSQENRKLVGIRVY